VGSGDGGPRRVLGAEVDGVSVVCDTIGTAVDDAADNADGKDDGAIERADNVVLVTTLWMRLPVRAGPSL
jgi:hypothetical protein